MTTRAIMVHSLDDARAALAAAGALGRAVTLVSGPGAAAYGGALWFRRVVELACAEYPGVEASAVLDCADAPGHVLGALRAGSRRIAFDGAPETARKLAEIARAQGAELVTEAFTTFDPRGQRDPVAACRAFLAAAS